MGVTDVRKLARTLDLVTPVPAAVTRPRLLFLCQCLPFPGDEGVKIRTFNILKRLSRDFEVRALCFYRRAAHPTRERVAAAIDGLREYADVRTYAIPQEYSRPRAAWDHVRSVLMQRVYTRFAYESREFRCDVEQALSEFQPQLVHVDSLDLSGYLAMIPADVPVVCVHHNVESALLRRRASAAAGIKARYFSLQAALTEKEEREYMPRVALNVAVSDPDRAQFEKIAPAARCITIPNGVDTSEIRPLADASDGIVFVGGATWFPNRDALDHFTGDILPRIRAKLGRDVPVTWVGQATEADREHFERVHGIRLTGYVDRIEPFIEQAACYVVPLRIGGGTRLKILYAWAMRRAIVSTAIGYEGLEGADGINILVRDEPDAFADAVVQVITDRSRRESLAAQGRTLVESSYDWDVITRSMYLDYSALLRKRPA